MLSTCELKSKQLWAGNEEKCISFSQLQLRDQTTGVAVRSVPPSSHPSNVSMSQSTWQQSVPHHTTHQNRQDEPTMDSGDIRTPNSQLPNLKSQILLIMRRSSTARPPAVYQQRAGPQPPFRQGPSEKRGPNTPNTCTPRTSQVVVVVVASSVGMGWVVFVLLTCCCDSGVWLLGARW